ncbi:MAG: hypothetical protein JRI23_07395 [Deltaproteobacteria bacterium]|nr:hypothetical protein [Deltaproteobacteria bacterium]MBW2531418.1 hypothetical protein [Deltaproteobacteria bacterium]
MAGEARLLLVATCAAFVGCASIAGLDDEYVVGDTSATGATTGTATPTASTAGTPTASATGTPSATNTGTSTAGGGGGTAGSGGALPDHCTNGARDGDETGMDCGGADCPGCPNGDPCGTGTDCASGFCPSDDQICCNAACDATCESCVASQTGGADGTCEPIPAFDDPDGECTSAPSLGCSGGAGCATCGASAPPVGGTCPAVCSRCDEGDTCVFNCTAEDGCRNGTVNCPAGWHCEVECGGRHSCDNLTINCPDHYDCDLECPTEHMTCANAQLICSATGACEIECGSVDSCSSADVYCGENSCRATCSGGLLPVLHDCPAHCACASC